MELQEIDIFTRIFLLNCMKWDMRRRGSNVENKEHANKYKKASHEKGERR